MRALVKYLDGIGDADIVGLNIPNGIPLVYELDADAEADQAATTSATPKRRRRPRRRSRRRARARRLRRGLSPIDGSAGRRSAIERALDPSLRRVRQPRRSPGPAVIAAAP